jgi:hypothetical protein
VIYPTVHLNGTSKDELLRQLCDAHAAIAEAMRAMSECAPNGRDYYPQGADALSRATAEHRGRVERLADVQRELMDIAEHID